MVFRSLLTAFAAVQAVSAGACPAKSSWSGSNSHGKPNGPSGNVVEAHPASSYGNHPWGQPGPGGKWGYSPAESPSDDLSTSEDARQHPWAYNSPEHRGNWIPGFDINTDTSEKWPETGKTVYATFEITNTTFAPDGGEEQIMLLVNNQYPGPLLEGNWGDHFEVTVINKLENNGTGIHWHGFRQFEHNGDDGVGGITECPIPPGGQKTYRFRATGYGSTWYHSHFSAQYGAGVIGPVLVHGPTSANWDIDLGNVLINEWYDLTVFQEDWFAHRFGPPKAGNYLVNGRNVKTDLSAGERTKFQFQPGKKHLMRFVNTAIDAHFKIRLDGHKLLVIANDNTPITPYYTTELSIGIGQRYDVVVEADQSIGNYYLRTIPAPACTFNANDGLHTANAYISYAGAPNTLPSTYGNATLTSPTCDDEPLASLVPIVPTSVDSTGFAAQFSSLPVDLKAATLASGERVFLWYLNSISQDIDWSRPTISEVSSNLTIADASDSSSYLPQEWSTISLPNPDVWTFWVIQNQFFVPHPMHLHGHDFSVLGQGNGTFSPAQHMGSLNFKNPTRRDVVMLPGSGWTVIAFKTDNPGAWLMHCHIAWHVGEGLSLEFVEVPSMMPQQYGEFVGEGSEFEKNCAAWREYEGTSYYGKSDNGLRKRTRKDDRVLEGLKEGLLREQMAKRY